MLRRCRIFLWGELPCFLSQNPLHPQRTLGKRRPHSRGSKNSHLAHPGTSYPCIYRDVKYEQALRRLNCRMSWGLLSPGKEVKSQSEERRGSDTDLTRWRSRVEISSQLQKIEWFRGCRQGANPSLSAGPAARAALRESRMHEHRTANGQGSDEESNPNPSHPPVLSSRQGDFLRCMAPGLVHIAAAWAGG